MRGPLPLFALLLLALSGCPGDDDDDTTTPVDDDDTTEEPVLGLPETLPAGWIWEEYTHQLAPQGYIGSPPYQWSVEAGALPDGVTLDGTGHLEGVPLEQGSFAVTLLVQDSAGHEGSGEVSLEIGLNPDSLFLALAFDEWPEICLDLDLLCAPWVRLDGAGEVQTERPLAPALYHVGLDGIPDAGRDDDVLLEMLDVSDVTFGWTPLQDPTGDKTTLFPDDTIVSPGGVLTAGENTGRGRVELAHPDHAPGHHVVFVVAPDWCPGYGC